MNNNKLVKFLMDNASQCGYKIHTDEDHTFKYENKRDYSDLLPGNVYGFVAELTETQKQDLFTEVMQLGKNAIDNICEFLPLYKNTYPLYWGKEDFKFQRLYAHLNGYKNNYSIRLYNYVTLTGISITYTSITVDSNDYFEKYLIKNYPCLLKTYKE